MNQSTPAVDEHILKKSMESTPIFFTGLSKGVLDIESLLTPLLCTSCKKNLRNFDTASNNLCKFCISKSEKNDQEKQFDVPSCSMVNSQHQTLSPNIKKPLLPIPTSPCSSNSSSESPVLLNNSQPLRNSVSPLDHRMEGLKSRSDMRKRLDSRSRPYHKYDRNNAFIDKNQEELSLTPHRQFTDQRNFHRNDASRFKSPPVPSWSSSANNSTEQLSREIWSLFEENKQSEDVFNRKMALRDKLHSILRERFPTCGLYVVGSSMTGLGAKSSDIDMCLMLTDEEVDQQKEAINILYTVKLLFQRYNFLYGLQVIPAKVPILKFADYESGIEVDLNINNAIGIRNTQLLSSYARVDKRLPPLVVLVKLWARHHGINDAKLGSLSSYSIVLMVIHYLQYKCRPPVLPCLQKLQSDKYLPNTDVRKLKLREELPDFTSENNEDLGDLFIGFLRYFSHQFDFKRDVMSVRLGSIVPRVEVQNNSSPKNKTAHWKFLGIEEPFDLTNTARAVFNPEVFKYIQYIFKESLKRILKFSTLNSVLS